MTGNIKHKILVVDDSPEDLQLVMLSLKDDYTMVAATSGEMALDLMNMEPKPEIVLMDVTMPGMDGYEACSKIKEGHPDIAVIFISANDTTDEVIQGFDVGGTDYIIKPIEPEILSTKLDLVLSYRAAHKEVHTQKDQATQTAMLAMTSSGEQSVIIEFLRKSFECDTYEAIAEALLTAMDNYCLNACVQIFSEHEVIELSHNDEITPVESELMTRMRDFEERSLSMNQRLFINYDGVTLLIKDMPIEDEDRCGRIRDYIQTIIHGAAVKQKAIEFQLGVEDARNEELAKLANDVQVTLQQVESDNELHKEHSVDIFDTLKLKFDEIMFNLGLTEEQEQSLIKIIDEAIEASLNHIDEGEEINEKLKSIISKLASLSQK
jgi:DNA-binding response OmpR family regulator